MKSRRQILAWLAACLGLGRLPGALAADASQTIVQGRPQPATPPIPTLNPQPQHSFQMGYEPVTYVCGRGEVENFFRHFEKPVGYEQDLNLNCALRRQALFEGIRRLEGYFASQGDKKPEGAGEVHQALQARYVLGQMLAFDGNIEKAMESFRAEQALAGRSEPAKEQQALEKILGVLAFRQGQEENWVRRHIVESSLFPFSEKSRFSHPESCREAVQHFTACLRLEPNDLEAKWLLNLAQMALGQYPQGIPADDRIPLSAFRSADDIGRFRDLAPSLGLDVFAMAGSVIMDDFDNDGYLDLVVSSADPCEPLRCFHNNGDGSFSDRTHSAGLAGQLGGLNIVQADYNNDGWLDILVMRGGWQTPVRRSLLRNNGNGTFTDVTKEAGLAVPATSTQAATWADFDNDGWLDLLVGNENAPSQLFHNNQDGTFTDVARVAGVDRVRFTKGAAWGDYDNDGYPDLYVSNEGQLNFLYHNNRNGTFTDLAERLGVQKPVWSFPVWFFDYDNDGWLDLYVSSHIESVTEVLGSALGLPVRTETQALYRNLAGRGFKDVTREAGLDRVLMPMGANFGDIDNDGYLDFYLGTGAPSYAALVPNVLYRNQDGRRFVDITTTSGTGSLQKGHGVSIGDLFNDGQPILFAELGGMVPGDKYYSAVFRGPATSNHWISVKLVGVKTNRAAIGARIKLTVRDPQLGPRNIYRHVSSGGSFGASPLRQHVGVGKATRIEILEIWWPASRTTQRFENVAVDQVIEVREFERTFRRVTPKNK